MSGLFDTPWDITSLRWRAPADCRRTVLSSVWTGSTTQRKPLGSHGETRALVSLCTMPPSTRHPIGRRPADAIVSKHWLGPTALGVFQVLPTPPAHSFKFDKSTFLLWATRPAQTTGSDGVPSPCTAAETLMRSKRNHVRPVCLGGPPRLVSPSF